MEISTVKQKVLLALGAGIVLGLSYSPKKQLQVLKGFSKEWDKINERQLKKEIDALYRSKLVTMQERSNGVSTFVLTEKGKLKELTFKFEEMSIEKQSWDKQWRLIVFDIPEKIREGRNALRNKLVSLGFYELQKSVFVFPYECKDEIEFLIEFFKLRKYVRYGLLSEIDNDLHLRKIFKLL
jgi:DNA-binding transcriptional regulator PaaX